MVKPKTVAEETNQEIMKKEKSAKTRVTMENLKMSRTLVNSRTFQIVNKIIDSKIRPQKNEKAQNLPRGILILTELENN